MFRTVMKCSASNVFHEDRRGTLWKRLYTIWSPTILWAVLIDHHHKPLQISYFKSSPSNRSHITNKRFISSSSVSIEILKLSIECWKLAWQSHHSSRICSNCWPNCENTLKSSSSSCYTFVAELYDYGQCYTSTKIFLPRPSSHMAPALSTHLEKQLVFHQDQQGPDMFHACTSSWENIVVCLFPPHLVTTFNLNIHPSV